MNFFNNDYNNKEKYYHDENAIYFGLYFLKLLDFFKLYMLLPSLYFFTNCLIIKWGVVYYRFFELFLFFTLVVLLFLAEVSKNNKQAFAYDKKGNDVLTYNVCINLLLIFIIYNFLIYCYMDLGILSKFSSLSYNAYFGTSPVTDIMRLTIGLLFIVNFCFSFSYAYFNKKLSYEFFILLAFAYNFLLICLICRNIFLLLIIIEGLSLSLIGCVCLSKNKIAYEVALKFFVLSAVFTVIGMLGALLILISTHTLDYRNLSFVSCFSFFSTTSFLLPIDKAVLLSGIILLISAILFKLGAFPFHSYVADFCSVSMYPLLFFFLGPLKLGIFFVLTLIYLMFFMFIEELNYLFLFVGLASILVGAKGAVSENELKRFLGFTSINQLGFVLLALSVPGFSAVAAAFIFFYIYVISNILFLYVPMQCFDKNNNEAFLYLNHFAYYSKLDNNNQFSMTNLKEEVVATKEETTANENFFFYTFAEMHPAAADFNSSFSYQFRFIVIVFSFIGIPPLPGFAGKYLIFYNLILSGHTIIVFIVMLISLISAYYYLNLIYKLFNKNKTPSFIVNYDFLKFYNNALFEGFHTFLFWAFLLLGIFILDPILFYNVILFLKNGF